MIRKLVRQMLTAQVFSALTVSLCLLIDNIMIGRFLGEKAIAAYGLANPLLLAIGALGSLLAAGVQVACSKSLGKGSQEETNAGYSSAVAVTAGVSLLFMAVVLLFRSPLAHVMGAGTSGELFEQTRDYLAGFSIGAPGSMGALVLVPFMQMAGQSNLLIAAVLGMTITDIGLDLLNGLVLHWGMFGMGLASALSYYTALIIGAFYFLSKRCVFRFSLKQVTGRKTAELFASGIPAGFNMLSSVILVFAMNRIVRNLGGHGAVAAFTVISTIGNSANCITTGIGGVSLTLAGILFNEEDRNGLKELTKQLCRYAVVLGLGMGILLLIFAPALTGLFLPAEDETRRMAILGLRMFAAGLIPCCVNNALKNGYQACGRPGLTEIISLLEGAVFPAAAAFLATRVMGITGAWLFFGAGELLTLLFIGVLIRRKTGLVPWKDGAWLLLEKSFGASEDGLLERDIHSMAEVTAAAREAEAFCLRHGQSRRNSAHIGLCIEEMAANTIQHGFEKDRKEHHLSVRVLRKPEQWVLRFRDDCGAFDPVHYVPEEGDGKGLGIRLVRALASEANYTYSLNLNNLMLKLPTDREPEQAREDR